ncbi:MAG: DUF4411 family protein, partial [Chloroflexi bacterium]|nr:DUF4411 family protein [Chloroflexota bacterium]
SGGCFADPFVVAKAWALGGVVVTEETFKDHAAKIPNMCQHFVIPYMSLQQFMHAEKWTF